jgi:hypothetical protein
MVELIKLKCKRCGKEWIPRTENPKVCALCKNPNWSKPKK